MSVAVAGKWMTFTIYDVIKPIIYLHTTIVTDAEFSSNAIKQSIVCTHLPIKFKKHILIYQCLARTDFYDFVLIMICIYARKVQI